MRSFKPAVYLAAFVTCSIAGCDDSASSDPVTTADAGRQDASVQGDASAQDDAGQAADAAQVDPDGAVAADSAIEPDAGLEADVGLEADAGPEADAGLEADAGSEADAGPEADAAPDPDAGPVEADLRGAVFMKETLRAGDGFPSLEAGAEFAEYLEPPVPAEPVEFAGDCHLVPAAAGNPGDFTQLSAGDITISGGPEGDVTMAYVEGAGAYVFDALNPNAPLDFWLGGEQLTVSAAGTADVGAFSVEVSSPTAAANVQPTQDVGLSRSGTTITWTPGAADMVITRIRAGETTIECFSGDGGDLDVPQDALAWLGDAAQVDLSIHRFGQLVIESDAPSAVVDISLEAVWIGNGWPLGD